MTYRIALTFEDGATRIIDCRAGEKLLDAAYRQKVNLPMDCSDGVCGTCKCRCEQGSYDLGDDYVDDALTADEAAAGLVLTCQMVPESNCVVAVPVPSSACKVAPAEHGAEAVAVELVSDSTIILTLKLDRPDALGFLPGQYVNLTVPGTGQHRSYSFSSRPGAGEASFLIRNLPDGLMSRWLAEEAKPGARMSFVGPFGSFFLRAVDRPVLMLAGGTGLAPLLSMLEILADEGTDQPVHLIYGVTRPRDLVEIDRIEALAARLPTFSWASCVVDPNGDHVLKGYVTDHLGDEHLHGGDCDIYLCGPPPMVEAVRGFLRDKDVEPANFHYEKFAASDPVPA
ncbi:MULTISPECIES: benzoate 1,2-dioxygenase electron transfer component BenC [unclassified Sphingomonas]|uniref:benzoate 1,2-dioxygenase electron transfer component BenC n=1 Tax=unclassified Sphingomonas TaxID=196159 RepID=UPI0006FC3496|nr:MULTISPECIES: benzoate 1,2-dioxygenase electron transfer component BenC [unclassified Sphingomonas]KQX25617.1 NADH oxidase [Sphingomonas sp. Root1294]KQY66608.1 NADH oxidase [Sphingomonas sp. Root50]KRB90068.1 NADH oxidase [Sphingomonas sp. Root720]